MKKLLSMLLSMAIFATLTTPAFAERELTVNDGDLWNDLVSYWQMNDDNWIDIIINGVNNGTPQNNIVFSSNSKVGSHAGFFDGVDDYIRIPFNNSIDLDQYPSITISGWVEYTAGSGGSNRLYLWSNYWAGQNPR